MSYWRMQLHPSKPKIAVQHTITSLTASFLGLDFEKDVGNLLLLGKASYLMDSRTIGISHIR